MKRREFIAGLGSAAAWPLAARAQQPGVPTVGFLNPGSPRSPAVAYRVPSFRDGLREMGFVEGRNVVIDYAWAEDRNDRMLALVAELVRRRVDVIAVTGTAALVAAKAATQSIPIIFQIGSDPVEAGFVAAFNRPGGNLTGIYNVQLAVTAKRLELLHQVVPTANLVAYFRNANNPVLAEAEARELQTAARILGVRPTHRRIIAETAEAEFSHSLGQEPTFAATAKNAKTELLDNLVDDGEDAGRNVEAESLRGLEVHDKIELGGLLHRQVGGFLSLEDATDIDAGLAKGVGLARSVAHKSTLNRVFSSFIDRRNGSAFCTRNDLLAPRDEMQIDIDAKPSDSKSAHVLESLVKVAFCLGLEYMQLPPKRIRRDLYVLGIRLGIWVFGVNKEAERGVLRNALVEQSQPFCEQKIGKIAKAGNVAPRTVEAGDETLFDWVLAHHENDRNCRRQRLQGPHGRRSASRNYGNFGADEVGRQLRDPFVLALRPAIFN
jgi:ABC transporter substrate binding protein